MNSPLNSPLYTTFPLFTPLWPIIFPSPPHLPPRVFSPWLGVFPGMKKAPTEVRAKEGGAYLLEVALIPAIFDTRTKRFTGTLWACFAGANSGK